MRSPRGAWLAMAVAVGLGGCAGTRGAPATRPSAERRVASEIDAAAASELAEAQARVGASGTISRAELLPVLDAGLGRFLQGVSTEPVVVEGRQGSYLAPLNADVR